MGATLVRVINIKYMLAIKYMILILFIRITGVAVMYECRCYCRDPRAKRSSKEVE